VQVSSPPPGLVVRVAGHEVNPALYGVAFPVMPGSVAVEVGGEGVVAAREEVQVRAGARVEVSPRVQVRVVEAAATGAGAGGVDARVAPMQAPVVERSSGPGAGPWVLVGIGGAAAVAGGVMLVLGENARGERDRNCPNGACAGENELRTATDAQDLYLALNPAGIAALAVGGTAIIGGLLWYALAPSHSVVRSARVSGFGVVPTQTGITFSIGGEL
jgi:hypothetical protein